MEEKDQIGCDGGGERTLRVFEGMKTASGDLTLAYYSRLDIANCQI